MASDELISETPMVIGSEYVSTDLPNDPAVKIDADFGGISIDAGKASNITTATGDLTIGGATQTNAVIIHSVEEASDAVNIKASGAGGGIDILVNNTFSIDGGAASNITTSAGDITIGTFDLVTQANAVIIESNEATVDAIHLKAENAAKIKRLKEEIEFIRRNQEREERG